MKIYAYTMVWDTGFAPSVDNNILSLACCKTYLRYKIANELEHISDEKIYVIGLCGKTLLKRNKISVSNEYLPVYIAKISDAVKVTEYYSDKKFTNRPDAQYIYKNSEWTFKKTNPHHIISGNKKEQILENSDNEKDLYYIRGKHHQENYVLLSEEYLYLGKNIEKIDFPNCIKSIAEKRSKACRSDLSPIELNDKEIDEFKSFIAAQKTKYRKQKGNTIDKYFIENSCKGERKCR